MKNIVVGVTGGIAAYKAVGLIRLLVLEGHDVHVVPTAAALQFVGQPTFEAISRNPVLTGLYDATDQVPHVALGQNADLIIVAPATAHSIAKMANGLADDLLGNAVLATSAPILIAPAMHTEMWLNAATQANISTLIARGVHVVGPGSGALTGTDSGPGRLAEPEVIADAARSILSRGDDLAGLRILVSAGGTREAIDPVRFIGNRSTGRQGIALARAAAERGAEVTLVVANLEIDVPSGITTVTANSAAQLEEAMNRLAPDADVIVMAAAVSDFRPLATSDRKIKKDDVGDRLTIELVANPDILAGLASSAREDRTVVGFAAETESDDEARRLIGVAKIARKGADFLVVNKVGWSEGFATPDNSVTVIDRNGATVVQANGAKLSVAHRILDLFVA